MPHRLWICTKAFRALLSKHTPRSWMMKLESQSHRIQHESYYLTYLLLFFPSPNDSTGQPRYSRFQLKIPFTLEVFQIIMRYTIMNHMRRCEAYHLPQVPQQLLRQVGSPNIGDPPVHRHRQEQTPEGIREMHSGLSIVGREGPGPKNPWIFQKTMNWTILNLKQVDPFQLSIAHILVWYVYCSMTFGRGNHSWYK